MKREKWNSIHRLTVGGLLLAIGIIIPRLFHMFGTPEIGKVFLPMHISVFIAGIYLGANYGAIIGFITPLINSLFGLPMFPFNLIMAFELASYGLFAGLFMYILKGTGKRKMGRVVRISISLVLSMIIGRIVNALVLFVMIRIFAMNVPAPFTVLGSAIAGIPGILIQLLLVPGIIMTLYASQEKFIR
jgi:niacin transporter